MDSPRPEPPGDPLDENGLPAAEVEYHNVKDPHRVGGARLAEVILGGQDGLVNTLGVILGVAAASNDTRLVLAAGLAATFAEAVSMGAVAYTSALANLAYYLSERDREYRHIRNAPRVEADEVRQIYAAKGFEGDLLDRIVRTITADPDVWVSVMMSEEHGLAPITRRKALGTAAIVFLAAMIGALIPLLPFFFLAIAPAIGVSIGVCSISLFAVGWYKARTFVGSPVRSGLEMAAIGIVSALVGYAIGAAFALSGA